MGVGATYRVLGKQRFNVHRGVSASGLPVVPVNVVRRACNSWLASPGPGDSCLCQDQLHRSQTASLIGAYRR